jgi:hypothetical protein
VATSPKWIAVSAEEASHHPLYGVRNWLAVFAFGVLLGFLRDVAELNSVALDAGFKLSELLSLNHPLITFTKISLVTEALAVAVIYWALFTKHRKFRVIASSVLVGLWPAIALIGTATQFDGLGEVLVLSLLSWLPGCAVWVTYLQRSRRVRVTFEHSVRMEVTKLGGLEGPHESPSTIAVDATSSVVDPPVGTHLRSPKQLPSAQASPSMTLGDPHQSDEDLWSLALSELEGESRRSGLWARCFASTNGVDSEAKARYLRERVQQLQGERAVQHAADAVRQKVVDKLAEGVQRLKSSFISGAHPTEDDVRQLVAAAENDPALARLWERFFGNTLLHWCARYDLRFEAERLLSLGADPCAGNGKAQRPHMLTRSKELQELLLNAALARRNPSSRS